MDTLAVRRSVTSPGGSTARGLAALEHAGVRAAFDDAMQAVLGAMTDVLLIVAAARDADRGLPQRAAARLHPHHLRLHHHAADLLVRRARPVLALVERGARLPARRLRALPRDLPALHPADRPARHQPDRRGPRPADRRAASSSPSSAGEPRAGSVARAGLVFAGVLAADQVVKALVTSSLAARRGARASSPASSSSTCATRASRSGSCRTAGRSSPSSSRSPIARAARVLRAQRVAAAGSGCRPGCCSAARSATSSTASARARSSTSSSSRTGRRSTSPTRRSRSAWSCSCSSWSAAMRARRPA